MGLLIFVAAPAERERGREKESTRGERVCVCVCARGWNGYSAGQGDRQDPVSSIDDSGRGRCFRFVGVGVLNKVWNNRRSPLPGPGQGGDHHRHIRARDRRGERAISKGEGNNRRSFSTKGRGVLSLVTAASGPGSLAS